jgi:hypothetical protein
LQMGRRPGTWLEEQVPNMVATAGSKRGHRLVQPA